MVSELQLNAHRLTSENHHSSLFQIFYFLNFDFFSVKDDMFITKNVRLNPKQTLHCAVFKNHSGIRKIQYLQLARLS